MFAENCSTRTSFLTAALYINAESLRKTLNLKKRKIIEVEVDWRIL